MKNGWTKTLGLALSAILGNSAQAQPVDVPEDLPRCWTMLSKEDGKWGIYQPSDAKPLKLVIKEHQGELALWEFDGQKAAPYPITKITPTSEGYAIHVSYDDKEQIATVSSDDQFNTATWQKFDTEQARMYVSQKAYSTFGTDLV